MLPSLRDIFRGRFADGFRRRAQLRKAGRLGLGPNEQRRTTMRFEPLEQRLLLSADLNPVIDNFLAGLNENVPQPAQIVHQYVADDGVHHDRQLRGRQRVPTSSSPASFPRSAT